MKFNMTEAEILIKYKKMGFNEEAIKNAYRMCEN